MTFSPPALRHHLHCANMTSTTHWQRSGQTNRKGPNITFLPPRRGEEVKAAVLTSFMLCHHSWWGRWPGLQRQPLETLSVFFFQKRRNGRENRKRWKRREKGRKRKVVRGEKEQEEEDTPLPFLWYSGQIQKTALHPSPFFLFHSRLCSHWLRPPYFQASEMGKKKQS